jgi:predicted AAA+ superfamily ATPase
MYYKREIEQKIRDATMQFPCVVLTGARQVGKTTLLRHCFPDHRFVSLDLPSLAEMAESDPQTFLDRYPAPLIIDEVQYAPKLFRNLKVAIDKDRHRMGQFILTGSQKFTLMREVSDSLAGRAAIMSLENLSAKELALEVDSAWTEVLAKGFYPELWRQKNFDHHQFYASYVASYLERDVRQILNVQSIRDFERFLRACAARSGQILNMSELGRDVGIKTQTAKDWLSVLEASNQISLLEPYFENVGKRIVKSPKLYLNDPGLLCFLLGIEAANLISSPLIGPVWESFIFAEFRKAASAHGQPGSLWFYRDDQGREVDFVKMHHGRLDLFETKWSENPDQKWFDRLNEVRKILSNSKTQLMGSSYMLCRTKYPTTRDDVQCLHAIDYFRSS